MKQAVIKMGVGVMGAVLLAVICSCTSARNSQKSIELFNGKDLEGWSYISADPAVPLNQVWSVQDKVLTCKGTPIGAIYKEPQVTNFRLIVEYRWSPGTPPGNSGIFSRITPPLKPIPQAVEVQLHHGNAGDILGLQGKGLVNEQPRFFAIKQHPLAGDIAGVKKLLDLEKPPGQWNRVEILAQADRYSVWMNGTLVNEARGIEINAGPVGLQSEGGVIQFRLARLIPLD